ncbi:hypothetical protein T484DRAFT_1864783 [Baffinella frigidus]|nr:hypothetical protein T484DRAFT_1864783 [Cryptophyta sp. CCMP2293]
MGNAAPCHAHACSPAALPQSLLARMLRLSLLAAAAASASAFAPAGFSPKLRSAAPTATMAMKGPDAAGMLAGAALSFSIILGGAPMMPADASVNSQMPMRS